jgi:hypothetical protein
MEPVGTMPARVRFAETVGAIDLGSSDGRGWRAPEGLAAPS